MPAPLRSVAVVGGGLAGLAAAGALQQAGVGVTVFDKGRSAGGRVTTRRREALQFDHGAQFFTVRTPAFAAALRPLQDQGVVQRWHGPFRTLERGVVSGDPRPGAERWVGAPGMSALPRAFAAGLTVVVGSRIDGLRRAAAPGGWLLAGIDVATGAALAHGPFDAVVVAIPTAQAHALLRTSGLAGPVADAAAARADALQPCLAALVAFAAPLADGDGAWFVTDDELAWAAHDGGKPGRSGGPVYVLHGAGAWSAQQFAQDLDGNAQALVAAFARCLGRSLPQVAHLEGHRWRYALAAEGELARACVVDADQRLALCGDGLVGGRVEGAWGSGLAAAEGLLAMR
ncbi:MAG: FAD-dependent oxidoreductase [Planctomycetes bacterium]|nr:FAD-dependent oxidoreductase [Planctomycetota bacterium]